MYNCEYCNKSFKRESSLAVHVCEPKRRALSRNDKHVVAGFNAYNFWYKLAMNSKVDKTYTEFSNSRYYSAFVKFGRYVLEIRAVNPESYIRWLTVNKVRLSDWTKDRQYNRYLSEASKTESADRALERFILLADEWATSHNAHWNEYFDLAPAHVIVNHIAMGKISPWIIYSSDRAQKFLDGLPADLLKQIADTLDPAFWHRKTSVFPNEVKFINEVIK
jgi:hypothetical protein